MQRLILLFVVLTLIVAAVLRLFFPASSPWVSFAAAAFISLCIGPLQKYLSDLTAGLANPQHYNYSKTLKKISGAMAHLSQPKRLAELITRIVAHTLRLRGSAIFIIDFQKNQFTFRAGDGEGKRLETFFLEPESPIVARIIQDGCLILKSRLKKSPENIPLIQQMERLGFQLVVPTFSSGKHIGRRLLAVLCLGDKKSGDKFSSEDLDLFDTLANQASVAVENAILYQEQIKSRELMLDSEKMAALGTMAAGIVHELRNPLAFMLTSAELLGIKGDDAEFRKNTLKLLMPEIQRMNSIIGTLLDYSRQKELQHLPVNLAEILEKVLVMLTFDIRHSQVKIKKDFHSSKQALGEESRLMQVFMNLISNAIQAMPNGGDLSLSVEDKDGQVIVRVADTGVGISKENLEKLATPFFTTKEKGTGLGLSITKRIIGDHKGRLEISSFVGRGSVFSVYLPAQI